MPGIFSKNARPKRPGSFFNFEPTPTDVILPNTAGTVCLAITHDWGPYKTSTLVNSLAEFQAIFGPSTDTKGYKAVKGCFKGEGVSGFGGAGAVLVHRFGTSAVKAFKTLQNTTPANAITLTAKYEGTLGNDLTATVQTYALDAAKDELVIKLGGVQVESFPYTPTDITALAADVNAGSGYATAAMLITGVQLSDVADQAFTTGTDGTANVAAADVTAVQTAVEAERFSFFAYEDLAGETYAGGVTVASLITSLKTWASNLNTKGKRFITVYGGALDENITTATDSSVGSAATNHSDFVRIGKGRVTDDDFGAMSTSELAPRIAGILAQRGENRSLTYARLQGVSLLNAPTESEILTAFDKGLVVLSLGSDPSAPVRIEKGLTTYTGGDASKPYLIYRNPKYVRTTHAIETELTEWSDLNVIGKLQVTDAVRGYVVGEAARRIRDREAKGILQPGSTIGIDQDPPPTSEDEFVAVKYGIKFGRSVEQVFNTVQIG